ncbi:hypothetical protein TH66_19265 [Carbonactinospora thermoautotrophica]|uniref:Uncharacterized protein n=1 Tax=Carbonactinospora thermoautotrophica TaxID=1469144 RepID=A0A132MIK9_9ACTN|nr:hypothetical protein TH66_19265 [Carbonactinospora thermoautotrophica]KWX00900.1 hypothetical protein LI90_1928 [Carbonactinospora thermoautotrophica]KWX03941.1 hypothetical protein TR74_24485 [Carbonactinospora thermoautotrophica]
MLTAVASPRLATIVWAAGGVPWPGNNGVTTPMMPGPGGGMTAPGMLTPGRSGAIWYHTWHGRFIRMGEHPATTAPQPTHPS